MGEKCQVCHGEGDIPVKVNLAFDKFEEKLEDRKICSVCKKRILSYNPYMGD